MKIFFRIFILFSILLGFEVGCTRLARDESRITLSVPHGLLSQNKTLSLTEPFAFYRMVVNVWLPERDKPIFQVLNAPNFAGSLDVNASAEMTVTVPSGLQGYVQVFLIYGNNLGEAKFLYGDASALFSPGNMNLPITVAEVGAGSLDGSKVAGRYFRLGGITPNLETIGTYYHPPGASKGMLIHKATMINGWFNAFAQEDIPLDIIIEGNGVIPDEPILTNFKLKEYAANDSKNMRIISPPSIRNYSDPVIKVKEKQDSVLIGFFGPGALAKYSLCSTVESYTYNSLFRDDKITIPLIWSNGVDEDKLRPMSKLPACQTSTIEFSQIPFDPTKLEQGGGSDALIGFTGVFKYPSIADKIEQPVSVFYGGGTNFTVRFSVLPGIPAVIDSIDVYYRTNRIPLDFLGDKDNICSNLPKNNFGFRKIGSIQLTQSKFTYDESLDSPSDLSKDSAFIFCPIHQRNGLPVGGGYPNFHLRTEPYPQEANALEFERDGYYFEMNKCQKVRLQMVFKGSTGEIQRRPVINSTNKFFSIDTASNETQVFPSESDCLNGTITNPFGSFSADKTPGELWIEMWVKTPLSSGSLKAVGANGLDSSEAKFNGFESQPSNPLTPDISHPITLQDNECKAVEINLIDDIFGFKTKSSSNIKAGIYKLDRFNGNQIQDDSYNLYESCSSTVPINTFDFPANQWTKVLYLKANGVAPKNKVFKLAIIANSIVSDIFSYSYINPPLLADRVIPIINNNSPIYEGDCYPLELQAISPTGGLANISDNLHQTWIPSLIKIFSDSKCTTLKTNSLILSNGKSSSLWIRSLSSNDKGLFELNSPNFSKPYTYLTRPFGQVPPFSIKRQKYVNVHLTSDVIKPGETDLRNWPIADLFVGLSLKPVNEATGSFSFGPDRKTGVVFNDAGIISGNLGLPATDNFALTYRFKIPTFSTPKSGYLLNINMAPYSLYVQYNCPIGSFCSAEAGFQSLASGQSGISLLAISQNIWHNLSIIRNGSSVNFYLDGASAGNLSTFNTIGATSIFSYSLRNPPGGAVQAFVFESWDSTIVPAPIGITEVQATENYLNERFK